MTILAIGKKHKPESVSENEAWKASGILSEVESSNPDKKTKPCLSHVDFVVSLNHWVKIEENEILEKYIDLSKKLKNYEGDSDTNYNWTTWNNPNKPDNKSEVAGYLKKNWNNANNCTNATD